MQALAVKHRQKAGFFSHCSVRLDAVVRYANEHHRLPQAICSKQQFFLYQDAPGLDVAKQFFLQNEEVAPAWKRPVCYSRSAQFSDYRLLCFSDLRPLLERYFSVTPLVSERELALVREYKLGLEHTIGVLYRGNNKASEARIAPYSVFFQKAAELQNHSPSAKFLVQTDELEFLEQFCARFPNTVYFETLPPIPRDVRRVITPPESDRIGFAVELLAAIRCLAQTAHLITGSGNVDIWTVLFRGHARNVHQFLDDRFLD